MKINLTKIFGGDSGAASTSRSVTFTGLNYEIEISKDRYDCRPFRSKWYNNSYFRFFIFAIIETTFYIRTGEPLFSKTANFFLIVVLTSLFILYYIIFSISKILKMNSKIPKMNSKILRMNHGAEHKILNAFENYDLKNADKYSRFSDGCGSNIFSVLIILVSISSIVKFPFTIFLIYYTLYMKLSPVKYIFFNTIGKAVQRLTTLEPTKEILDNTRKGFETLLYTEIEKIFKDEIEKNISIGKELSITKNIDRV